MGTTTNNLHLLSNRCLKQTLEGVVFALIKLDSFSGF